MRVWHSCEVTAHPTGKTRETNCGAHLLFTDPAGICTIAAFKTTDTSDVFCMPQNLTEIFGVMSRQLEDFQQF
jgi:hypothetical protein